MWSFPRRPIPAPDDAPADVRAIIGGYDSSRLTREHQRNAAEFPDLYGEWVYRSEYRPVDS